MKIGVIGIGYWNHYVRLISEHPDCELTIVCDLNQENLDKVKQKYPNVAITTKSEDLYEYYLDGVVICTPVTTHFKLCNGFIIQGIPILCEKAFTYTSGSANWLIDIAEDKNVPILVSHTYEYNSCVQHIKKLLDEKALGDIYYVSMTRVGLSPIRQDCNAFWDLGAHDVSMLINWFGMPQSVSASGNSYLQDGLHDVVFANLEFSNNIMAHIKCSWLNPVKRRNITIVGSEKMLTFDDIQKEVIIYDKQGEYLQQIEYKEPLKEVVNDFVEVIKNNKKPLVDGLKGLKVVHVLEAAQRSLESNSSKITL